MRKLGSGAWILPAIYLLAAAPDYRSATVDQTGQLHIITGSGEEIRPQKIHGQIAFDSPQISPDRRTVGWLVMYPAPTPDGGESTEAPIAGELAIYRDGRIIHTFTTNQIFWDWQFQHQGRRVAYSTGPTHGGAAECVLRELDSGRIVAHWRVESGAAPAWARDLRQ